MVSDIALLTYCLISSSVRECSIPLISLNLRTPLSVLEPKEAVSKTLSRLITDGLPAYHDAFNKEFRTRKNPPEPISTIRLSGDMNNNKMERFNGEVRDREKVMRNLKKKDSSILDGYQIYHNFIREQ